MNSGPENIKELLQEKNQKQQKTQIKKEKNLNQDNNDDPNDNNCGLSPLKSFNHYLEKARNSVIEKQSHIYNSKEFKPWDTTNFKNLKYLLNKIDDNQEQSNDINFENIINYHNLLQKNIKNHQPPNQQNQSNNSIKDNKEQSKQKRIYPSSQRVSTDNQNSMINKSIITNIINTSMLYQPHLKQLNSKKNSSDNQVQKALFQKIKLEKQNSQFIKSKRASQVLDNNNNNNLDQNNQNQSQKFSKQFYQAKHKYNTSSYLESDNDYQLKEFEKIKFNSKQINEKQENESEEDEEQGVNNKNNNFSEQQNSNDVTSNKFGNVIINEKLKNYSQKKNNLATESKQSINLENSINNSNIDIQLSQQHHKQITGQKSQSLVFDFESEQDQYQNLSFQKQENFKTLQQHIQTKSQENISQFKKKSNQPNIEPSLARLIKFKKQQPFYLDTTLKRSDDLSVKQQTQSSLRIDVLQRNNNYQTKVDQIKKLIKQTKTEQYQSNDFIQQEEKFIKYSLQNVTSFYDKKMITNSFKTQKQALQNYRIDTSNKFIVNQKTEDYRSIIQKIYKLKTLQQHTQILQNTEQSNDFYSNEYVITENDYSKPKSLRKQQFKLKQLSNQTLYHDQSKQYQPVQQTNNLPLILQQLKKKYPA